MTPMLDSGGGGGTKSSPNDDGGGVSTTDGDSGVISVSGPTATGETRTVDVQEPTQTTRHWVTTNSSGGEEVTESGEVTSTAATSNPDMGPANDPEPTPDNQPAPDVAPNPGISADLDGGILALVAAVVLAVGIAVVS